MKAKEYFEKYRDGLMAEDDDAIKETAWKMYLEMSEEAKQIIGQRKVHSDKGAVAVLKEMNDRHNAVIGLFQKNCLWCPLERNGFMIAWKKRIPEIAGVK